MPKLEKDTIRTLQTNILHEYRLKKKSRIHKSIQRGKQIRSHQSSRGRRELILRGNPTLNGTFHSEISECQWPNEDWQKISVTKEQDRKDKINKVKKKKEKKTGRWRQRQQWGIWEEKTLGKNVNVTLQGHLRGYKNQSIRSRMQAS